MDILLGLFLFFVIWAFDNLKKYFRLKSQIEKIKWCKSDLTFDRINDLGFEFVKKGYRFHYNQDAPYVIEILKNFKSSMQSRFFNDNLSTEKKMYNLSDKDYVMVYLHSYLCNMDMHTKIAEKELIEHFRDTDKFTTEYTLTNSGFAFYRLLYIVTSYCVQTENIQKACGITNNLYNIEKIIDSGILTFYKW